MSTVTVLLCLSAIVCTPVLGYIADWSPHNPVAGTPSPVGSIWPRPPVFNSNNSSPPILVDIANFEIVLDTSGPITACPELEWARSHYTQLIRNLRKNETIGGELKSLTIRLTQECAPARTENASEFYSLAAIRVLPEYPAEAFASAVGYLGAIRALETFFQMLWPSDDTYAHYYVNETTVTDQPRFVHRGIMLDSARHYLPENTIMKILTIMMYNKFNVLHWHIVDDQSFPYVSKKFPELSEKGRYHREAVFTPEAVQRIINGARARGIRVILEFDTPGHAGGFRKSHQELLTPCYGDGVNPGTPNHPYHTDYENIDPSNEAVYEFMREFFQEIADDVISDPYVHLGMDEAYEPCWASSPIIRDFMMKNNYTAISQVQGHYTTRLVQIVKDLGIKPIAWQDPLDSGVELDTDVVVQVWKEGNWQAAWEKALDRGHKVLFSSCWYINLIAYGEKWRDYYECDPILDADVEPEQIPQVLGGEACIWGEFVDQTNIIHRLFPFASAVGAVLWSSERDSTDDAAWALDKFRCSLLSRGFRAKPIQNGHCGPLETEVNVRWNYK